MVQPHCYQCKAPRDGYWCRGEGTSHFGPVLVGVPSPTGVGADQLGQGPMRFLVKDKLGQGGMNEIYRAYDTETGNDIVLKIVREQFWTSKFQEHMRKRAENESHILSTLRGRFYPECYGAGVVETPGMPPLPYIAMEWVQGAPLHTILKQPENRGGLPLERFFHIATQLSSALYPPHAETFYHRDLAPDNILVRTVDGWENAVLLDWGIARIDYTPSTELIKEHKSRYSPPEQLRTRPGIDHIDNRVDIYSLGIVLWEMLTGHHPMGPKFGLDQPTSQDIMFFHSTQRPPIRYPIRPDAPEALIFLLKRMFALEPRERPASIQEVCEQLWALRAGHWRHAHEEQRAAIEQLQKKLTPHKQSLHPSEAHLLSPDLGRTPLLTGGKVSPSETHTLPPPSQTPSHLSHEPMGRESMLPTSQLMPPSAAMQSPKVSAQKPWQKYIWAITGCLLGGLSIAAFFIMAMPATPPQAQPIPTTPRARRPLPHIATRKKIAPQPLRRLPATRPPLPRRAILPRLLVRSRPTGVKVYRGRRVHSKTPFATDPAFLRAGIVLYQKKRIACRINWAQLRLRLNSTQRRQKQLTLLFNVAPAPAGLDFGISANPSPCTLVRISQ